MRCWAFPTASWWRRSRRTGCWIRLIRLRRSCYAKPVWRGSGLLPVGCAAAAAFWGLRIGPDFSQSEGNGVGHALGAEAVFERVGSDNDFHGNSPVSMPPCCQQVSTITPGCCTSGHEDYCSFPQNPAIHTRPCRSTACRRWRTQDRHRRQAVLLQGFASVKNLRLHHRPM